jgi:hypothetical protein
MFLIIPDSPFSHNSTTPTCPQAGRRVKNEGIILTTLCHPAGTGNHVRIFLDAGLGDLVNMGEAEFVVFWAFRPEEPL